MMSLIQTGTAFKIQVGRRRDYYMNTAEFGHWALVLYLGLLPKKHIGDVFITPKLGSNNTGHACDVRSINSQHARLCPQVGWLKKGASANFVGVGVS